MHFQEILQQSRNSLLTPTPNNDPDGAEMQAGLFEQLEQAHMARDILGQAATNDSLEQYSDGSLEFLADQAIRKWGKRITIDLRQTRARESLSKGKLLFAQKRYQEALDVLEDVLQIEPDNKEVHSILTELHLHPEVGTKASAMASVYRFHYQGSFGHKIIGLPVAIEPAPDGSRLYVSDHTRNMIHQFSLNGDHLGPIPIDVQNPMGIFVDGRERLWVCDFGNSRLLSLDGQCQIESAYDLKQPLASLSHATHPMYGCWAGDCLYLIVGNVTKDKLHIVQFAPGNLMEIAAILPNAPLAWPCDIRFLQGRLFTASYSPPIIAFYDPGQQQFRQFNHAPLPDKPRRYILVDDNLLVAAGQFIVKVSMRGEAVFTADPAHCANLLAVSAVGVAAMPGKRGKVLFVSDNLHKCIHSFAI